MTRALILVSSLVFVAGCATETVFVEPGTPFRVPKGITGAGWFHVDDGTAKGHWELRQGVQYPPGWYVVYRAGATTLPDEAPEAR